MKIGIDIDDTTFFTIDSMLKYANEFEKEISGNTISKEKFGLIKNRFYLEEIFGWNKETIVNFFNKYYKIVLDECTMLPNANNIIKKLKDDGHTIHFITARFMNIDGCDTKTITEKSLGKYNIPYDTLNLNISNKLEFSKKMGIDLFIEDSYETCKELSYSGIKSILMTTKMNSKIETGEIIRVNSWNEIYNRISQ